MNAITRISLEALAVQGLVEALREAGGDDEAVAITVASESNVEELAREAVRGILQDEAHAQALKETQATLRSRADRLLARGQRCRGALLAVLETLGLKRLALPEATVSAGRGAPGVLVTDEPLIPPRFRRADPRVEAAYAQLLRAAAFAASRDCPELQADFAGTAEALLAHFAIDRKALLAALKDGETVPGAQLSNGSSWLMLRTV